MGSADFSLEIRHFTGDAKFCKPRFPSEVSAFLCRKQQLRCL